MSGMIFWAEIFHILLSIETIICILTLVVIVMVALILLLRVFRNWSVCALGSLEAIANVIMHIWWCIISLLCFTIDNIILVHAIIFRCAIFPTRVWQFVIRWVTTSCNICLIESLSKLISSLGVVVNFVRNWWARLARMLFAYLFFEAALSQMLLDKGRFVLSIS